MVAHTLAANPAASTTSHNQCDACAVRGTGWPRSRHATITGRVTTATPSCLAKNIWKTAPTAKSGVDNMMTLKPVRASTSGYSSRPMPAKRTRSRRITRCPSGRGHSIQRAHARLQPSANAYVAPPHNSPAPGRQSLKYNWRTVQPANVSRKQPATTLRSRSSRAIASNRPA